MRNYRLWKSVDETCVVCPTCGFTFSSKHVFPNDKSGYLCYRCETISLNKDIESLQDLREELINEIVDLEDRWEDVVIEIGNRDI
jgi:transposase-like protein